MTISRDSCFSFSLPLLFLHLIILYASKEVLPNLT